MSARRFALFAVALTAPIAASFAATPGKGTIEMWGLDAGDAVTIDGANVTVKSGGPRVFAGEPEAIDAPVLAEVAAGKHEVVVRRGSCAPRAFSVVAEPNGRRVIVLEKEDPQRCAIPFAPPRR